MAYEQVGIEIVVKDSGTPVVRRHRKETVEALDAIEQKSKTTGATVDRTFGTTIPAAVNKTTAAAKRASETVGDTQRAGSLVHGMGKAQQAAMALTGGLSQAGAGAARFTGAMSTLILTGLTPFGALAAGAATAIGLMVSAHAEGAEAAEKQRVKLEELRVQMMKNAATVADITTGLNSAAFVEPMAALAKVQERRAFLSDQIARMTTDAVGTPGREIAPEFRGGGLSPGEHAARAREELFALNAEATRYIDILNTIRAAEAARGMRTGAGPIPFITRGRFDAFGPKSETEGGQYRPSYMSTIDAMTPSREPTDTTWMETPSTAPLAIFGEGPGQSMHEGGAQLRAHRDSMAILRVYESKREAFVAAGVRVGDAFTSGISASISDAILTGELDMAKFATSMAETFVRAMVDALAEAAIGAPVRSAFGALFGSVFASLPAPGVEAAARGPVPGTANLTITPPEVRIAPEEVLNSLPEREARTFVGGTTLTASRRGSRA